ncbi:hypothetical protein BT93_G0700 [Corymbia citriodora subsp. variegata]|nr:hypothetical protein BT93_G0700 [Corymbia citriodora subsp. variegata]
MKLAREWKAKLSDKSVRRLEALAFLYFLAAYNLVSPSRVSFHVYNLIYPTFHQLFWLVACPGHHAPCRSQTCLGPMS